MFVFENAERRVLGKLLRIISCALTLEYEFVGQNADGEIFHAARQAGFDALPDGDGQVAIAFGAGIARCLASFRKCARRRQQHFHRRRILAESHRRHKTAV